MKNAIATNHVGFPPQGAKHFVIADPPETSFTVDRGLWGPDAVCRGEHGFAHECACGGCALQIDSCGKNAAAW